MVISTGRASGRASRQAPSRMSKIDPATRKISTNGGVKPAASSCAAAMAQLDAAGFTPPFVEILRVAGSIFDILLGACLLARPLARPVLITMLAVTPIYLIMG